MFSLMLIVCVLILGYDSLQSVPPTTWYRLVAGLNAHLRLVRRGCLRKTFRPVLRWLESHAHPKLKNYGLRIDLAWFQATACGYCQYGLLVYAVDEDLESLSVECPEQPSRYFVFSFLFILTSLYVPALLHILCI